MERNYITRMDLIESKGWSKKMTEVLLQNVDYKAWGNYYRRSIKSNKAI